MSFLTIWKSFVALVGWETMVVNLRFNIPDSRDQMSTNYLTQVTRPQINRSSSTAFH